MAFVKMTHFLVILVLKTLAKNTDMHSVSDSCTEDHGELSCENIASEQDIPHTAPVGIHTVCIIGSEKIKKLQSSPFHSVSWKNISELYISNFLVLDSINKDFLAGLRGLKLLSICSCQYLNEIPEELLKETPDIEALYLDWLPFMTMSLVEKLLRNSVPNLRYLSLIAINTVGSKSFIIGNDFIEAIGTKNLTFLDLSLSSFRGAIDITYVLQKSLLHLQYFNISNTPFSITTPDVSLDPLLHLDVIDYSGCVGLLFSRMDPITNRPKVFTSHHCSPELSRFRYYIMSHLKVVWDHPLQLDWTVNTTNPEECRVENIRLLDISKNRIQRLNITLFGRYSFVNLVKVDLSYNNMEYLSPSLLSVCPRLKIINLDGNTLGRMEDMNDFQNLFDSMKSIEIINLKDNGLTRLPVNLGYQNKELRILDLKGNHLRQFEMAVGTMEKIVLIDLSNNYIDVLSNKIIDDIQHIHSIQQSNNYINVTWPRERDNLYFLQKKSIRMAYAYNSNRKVRLLVEENSRFPERFTIDISGNSLQCSCDNVYFPKWIISTDVSLFKKESLNCIFYGEKLDIKEDMIDKMGLRCRLPRTIAIIVTLCILCFIGIFLSFYFIFRQRRKVRIKYRIKQLKREIKEQKMSYIVFVSCSSDDQDIADKWIVPVINDYLKEKLEIIDDLAVTGFETIIPGMMLANEIHRCIEDALVVVLVVTDHFLESDWCNLEGFVANQYNIPLVILIKESTRCENKSKTINHALKHFGRAEWSTKNDRFRIRPSWNVICDGILGLAAESLFRQKEKKNRDCTREQDLFLQNDNVELILR